MMILINEKNNYAPHSGVEERKMTDFVDFVDGQFTDTYLYLNFLRKPIR